MGFFTHITRLSLFSGVNFVSVFICGRYLGLCLSFARRILEQTDLLRDPLRSVRVHLYVAVMYYLFIYCIQLLVGFTYIDLMTELDSTRLDDSLSSLSVLFILFPFILYEL